eukprot:TRINITY_DN799_c0_g6_i1.p1 TRINITY_DN799_c0_g6~~TRINITY_DN799_c0_g6_i1.p1  ORF type:complete len:301 (+),score=83.70 TRINITY_DN799_c0_g6_i1:591-1493(+)
MDGKVIKGDQVQLFDDLYGVHPRFFSGDFNQAMNKAKTEFKPLLVYLHNERVEAVWNYCGQALCTVQLSQFIDDHFVFLGVNVDETSEQILSSAFDILAFPCFVVLANANGANNILEIIQGPETVDDTLVRFLTIMETHGPILAKMKGENGKREGLRRLKEEQDLAFQSSLKEDKRKEEEEEREKRETKRKEEEERKVVENKKQEKQRLREQLPAEPDKTSKDVSHVIIRLPNGSRLERRFNSSEKLGTVYNFINSIEQEIPSPYILETPFPKQRYEDKEASLKEAGLFPKVMLYLVALD